MNHVDRSDQEGHECEDRSVLVLEDGGVGRVEGEAGADQSLALLKSEAHRCAEVDSERGPNGVDVSFEGNLEVHDAAVGGRCRRARARVEPDDGRYGIYEWVQCFIELLSAENAVEAFSNESADFFVCTGDVVFPAELVPVVGRCRIFEDKVPTMRVLHA